MTLAVINRIPVVRLSVVRRRSGRASVQATLGVGLEDAGLSLEAPVALEIGGVTAFEGSTWRLGRAGGLAVLTARDGAGLEAVLPPKYYKDTTFNLVATDILREAGERGVVNLPGEFARYSRLEAPGYRALQALLFEQIGANWRTRLDGSLVVGAHDPGAASLEWGEDLLGSNPERNRFEALISPSLEPGMTLTVNPYGEARTGVLQMLEHCIDGARSRTYLWL